ncbi:Mfa1 family fimbria major subunit [Marseilla massiliensis]|uniref:Mfa1 fimbrilin C-terminal domain-containing protein n=2 Tax=Bacteria TaxID=2 RepID=A0A939B894_9BACT|nr:Mfa1 family fimbria major subunit [Marseilla massiliensis]MBM6674590.1 Mfa1 fimbrilin C-terminal domain-containing protein [Marseilla massiliensis]
MKHDKYKWLGSALCLALILVMASCSMSDDMECPPDNGGEGQQVYVQLRLTVPSSGQGTRAGDTPEGGEENNEGREEGQEYENTISSALVFFYRADNNINADGSTPIDEYASFTVSGMENGNYVTNPVQVPLEFNTTYNLIAVANPGNDGRWERLAADGLTLAEVRDNISTQVWTETGDVEKVYSNFMMSSEDGSEKLTVTDANTSPDNPAGRNTSIYVERIAARLDYQVDNEYTCNDPQYPGARVVINGAAILNRFTAGSYLIKRVTIDNKLDGSVTYLGDEEPANGGMATNYVIDPWTLTKNESNNSFTLPDADGRLAGTQVDAAGLYNSETFLPKGSDDPAYWAGKCSSGTAMEGEGAGWYRVGYMLENITSSANTSKDYNTGIVFKAEFIPDGLVGYDKEKKPTFFSYDGTLYATLTGMMGALNSQQDFAQYVEGRIKECRSWADVTAFADKLNDPTGYAEYLRTNQNGYFTVDAVTTWTKYLSTELGVFEDPDNGPKINQGEKNTRKLLYASSGERLRTYYNSQCYYVWWLRHSNNNDDTTNGVMEYAIVRNNIYKVNVTGVYSLGGDIPGDEELRANVYVKDWEGLDPETLPM